MEKLTPEQHTGRAIDATSSREFLNNTLAQNFFRILKHRLEDVNSWHVIAGQVLAKFVLVDSNGQDVQRPPLEGDHFRIDIPGPGSKEGDGFDWVRIEAVHLQSSDDSESYGFTVRPSPNPNSSSTEIAHFYSEKSTSTFIVKRDGTTVTAEVNDRNIMPNAEAEGFVDNLRDAMVGTAGALAFSKLQWQRLTNGLISDALD